MAFRKRSFSRSRRQPNTNHWMGFSTETTLTTLDTFSSVEALTQTDYEVNANVQATASLTVVVGGIVIILQNASSHAVGFYGLGVFDKDFAAGNASMNMNSVSLTDERWLFVKPWACSSTSPFQAEFRTGTKARLRDSSLVVAISLDNGNAAPGVLALTVGRCLLKNL